MQLRIIVFMWFSYIITFTDTNVGESCVDKETNTAGCCRLLSDCPSAEKKMQLFRIRPTLCSFIREEVVVCCKKPCNMLDTTRENRVTWHIDDTITHRTISRSDVGRLRISEKKCKDFSKLAYSGVSEAISFKSDTQLFNEELVRNIAGGADAHLGEFPHMAAIGWLFDASGTPVFLCGGSLISDKFVLTASHCTSKPVNDVQIEPSIVRLGDHNIEDDNDGATPVDVKIERIIKHPEYRPPAKYNDIALVEMRRYIKFTPHIMPACLYTRVNYNNIKIATVTGWGSTLSGEQKNSAILQKAVLNIIDNKMCSRLWARFHSRNFPSFMEYQVCAGVLKGGIDTCPGDSGGPLQVNVINDVKQYYIIGVISFGKDCAKAGMPGIYTIVPYFIDWIESIVWPERN